MAAVVEWPLEAFRHIAAVLISSVCHYFRGHPAAAARAADEVQRVVFARSRRSEGRRESLRELGIDPAIRKRLPLHHHDAAPQRRQVRYSYKGPFCLCPHINQRGFRIGLETFPGFRNWNVFNVDNFRGHSARPQRLRSCLEGTFYSSPKDTPVKNARYILQAFKKAQKYPTLSSFDEKTGPTLLAVYSVMTLADLTLGRLLTPPPSMRV